MPSMAFPNRCSCIAARALTALRQSRHLFGPIDSEVLLTLSLDQFQHPELLLCNVGQRDRQPYALRVENAKTPAHEPTVRPIHRLFEQVLGTAGAMAHIDSLPIRTATRAAIKFRRRRVAAFPAAEHAVGAILLTPAQGRKTQHRPDQEANARIFRPVAGRCYSGSSSASMASCAITSDTAADLWTIGTAPA